jgi:hypothetical protein
VIDVSNMPACEGISYKIRVSPGNQDTRSHAGRTKSQSSLVSSPRREKNFVQPVRPSNLVSTGHVCPVSSGHRRKVHVNYMSRYYIQPGPIGRRSDFQRQGPMLGDATSAFGTSERLAEVKGPREWRNPSAEESRGRLE